ncbi:S49 family peptidase [Methylorubrum populi]
MTMTIVLDAAIGFAWAMEEIALTRLFEIAAREHPITPQALEAYRAEALERGERATVRNGVAILRVEGPLFKRASLMTEHCGASSYDVLRRDLAAAVDNPGVRAIMLAIDSPGGEAAGCAEFAAAVADVRGRKPIVAYVADVGASAAYWIASACDRIICGPSAALGSIGVRMSMADTRDRDARSGVRRFDFVSSQSPYKVNDPATEDGSARIKARVDALAQVFVDAVADNRGVSAAQVLDGFGRGDVLIGAAAVAAGMADGLGTFESVLADLSASKPLAPRSVSLPPPRASLSAVAPKAAPRPVVPAPRQLSAAEVERIETDYAVLVMLKARRMALGQEC